MKFIFWQNIISIHQSAFIKALAENHEVTLVAEEKLDKQRVSESWNIPEMGNAKVVISPSDTEIESLLADENVNNVFSGIDAFPMVYSAFKRAVALNRNITVMAEPYDWTGIKGKVRQLKYMLLFAKYKKHISHFFTTGNHGIRCFNASGMSLAKLHQWGYFTESNLKVNESDITVNSLPKVIFVGKIDQRKNVISLVEALNMISDLYDETIIIGTGPLEDQLKTIIEGNDKMHYLGSLQNDVVKSRIRQCDLLVLPSLFDGWGAVVNEALSQGTRVLCSDRCGAEILLDGIVRGGSFSLANDSLPIELKKWLKKGALSKDERNEIRNWAESRISGKVAADYFVATLNSMSPKAPWLL